MSLTTEQKNTPRKEGQGRTEPATQAAGSLAQLELPPLYQNIELKGDAREAALIALNTKTDGQLQRLTEQDVVLLEVVKASGKTAILTGRLYQSAAADNGQAGKVLFTDNGYNGNDLNALKALDSGDAIVASIRVAVEIDNKDVFKTIYKQAQELLTSENPFLKLKALKGQAIKIGMMDIEEDLSGLDKYSARSCTGIVREVKEDGDHYRIVLQRLDGKEMDIRSQHHAITEITVIAPAANLNVHRHAAPEEFLTKCLTKGTAVTIQLKNGKTLEAHFEETAPSVATLSETVIVSQELAGRKRFRVLNLEDINQIATENYRQEADSPFSEYGELGKKHDGRDRKNGEFGGYQPPPEYEYQEITTVYQDPKGEMSLQQLAKLTVISH